MFKIVQIILKIILVLIFLAGLVYAAKFVLKNDIYKKLQKNEDISIMFLSTDGKKFKGAYLVNYSPSRGVVFVCNMNSSTRFPKQTSLQKLFQKSYSEIEFLKEIEEIFRIKIDYYLHFTEEDLDFFNRKYQLNIDKDILFYSDSQDEKVLAKSLNLEPFFSQLQSLDFLAHFWRKSKLNSNLSSLDFFYILNNFHSFYDLKIVFIGLNSIVLDDEKLSLREMMYGEKELSQEIVVEVLNASKISGLALDVARKLRDQNVDVQSWGNFGKIIDRKFIIVIDRNGSWQKSFVVADGLRKLGYEVVVFSKQNKEIFTDASVILNL